MSQINVFSIFNRIGAPFGQLTLTSPRLEVEDDAVERNRAKAEEAARGGEEDDYPVRAVRQQAGPDAAGAVLRAPLPRRAPRPRGRDRPQVPRPHRPAVLVRGAPELQDRLQALRLPLLPRRRRQR